MTVLQPFLEAVRVEAGAGIHADILGRIIDRGRTAGFLLAMDGPTRAKSKALRTVRLTDAEGRALRTDFVGGLGPGRTVVVLTLEDPVPSDSALALEFRRGRLPVSLSGRNLQ